MTWRGHKGLDEAVRSMVPWLLLIICVTCWSSGGADYCASFTIKRAAVPIPSFSESPSLLLQIAAEPLMGLHRTLRAQVPPKLFRNRSSSSVLPEGETKMCIHKIYVDFVTGCTR